ncbi:hypothetical protein MNBD_GAMMA11-1869 [hydrothermal vent metagenome]|uniref:Uncharacterized protein n=1 Tax=hydrothermal vent metagenome TaxID=652676 RepID=A0A3B0XBL5_9ZZZZ
MNKLLFIFFISICLSVASAEQAAPSHVPVAVSDVTTYRIGKYIVKIIEYNTRAEGKLGMELFVPPEYKFIQRRIINKINVNIDGQDQVLDFKDTAGVFFDNITVEKEIIKFRVEFHVRRGVGYYLSECSVDVNSGSLPEPVCHHIPNSE